MLELLANLEDILLRLSSRSPTNLLVDEWTRIEQRKNEMLRARKAQAHEAERTVDPDGRRLALALPMAEPWEVENGT